MQADGKISGLSGAEDRPVAAPPEGLGGAWRNDDLAEGGIAGALLDLRHGGWRVLLRHDNAGAQPRLWLDPGVKLPLINGVGERCSKILILLLHAAARERDQHSDLDPVAVEVLGSHQRQVRARRTPVGRIGVDALAGRLHARVRQLRVETLTQVRAKGASMFLPARREVWSQRRRRLLGRMNVAVDDCQPLLQAFLPNRRVHGTFSLLACSCPPNVAGSARRG